MFIPTEETPNPRTLRFLPDKPVLEQGSLEFKDAHAAAISPLAQRLFEIDGVVSVFLGTDFISVTRRADIEWAHLKPAILGGIMEHFMSGRPVVDSQATTETTGHNSYEGEDAETVMEIKRTLDSIIRPGVARDGGDVTFGHYENKIVYLRMRGACSGCPSAFHTLKSGIMTLLRSCIDPEKIRDVRSADDYVPSGG